VACATAVVARRFRDILHRLQVDSDAAGICPLPKYRISQVRLGAFTCKSQHFYCPAGCSDGAAAH
jgi:hypothetical protein